MVINVNIFGHVQDWLSIKIDQEMTSTSLNICELLARACRSHHRRQDRVPHDRYSLAGGFTLDATRSCDI